MARPITFHIWLGGSLVAEQTVEESTIRIGHARTSHVRLEHPSVSRVHCVIEVGAELEIMDLGSAAGTFINSAPVTRASIRSGDQLRVGDYVLDVIAAEPTNLLGSPVRARSTLTPDPGTTPSLVLPAPAILDVTRPSGADLPAPSSAAVVLPAPAVEVARPRTRQRPTTVELQESDLIDLAHDADPMSRSGDRK